LKLGEYTATFGKIGFSLPLDGPFPRLPPPVQVADGNTPARIDAEMSPWATLAGRVLNSDGDPVAGIEVQANLGRTVNTDSNGKFAFGDLEPGAYTLLARPSQAVTEGLMPLPTYFPSAVDPVQAEPIKVSAGVTLAGFEIRLRSEPVYKVRGKVLDQSGKPAARAMITLTGLRITTGCMRFATFNGNGRAQIVIGHDCPAGVPGTQTRTDDEGAFEFRGVRTGEWSVRADYESAWDEASNMPMIQLGSSRVSVGHEDIDDLHVRVAALVPLQATVDWSGAPADDALRKASLTLISEDGAGGNKGIVTDPGQPPALVPPGRTFIAPGQPVDGYVLTSVLFGDREALGEVVDIEAGAPPLHLVYKHTISSISGTVEKGPDATVLVFQTATEGDIIVNAYPCHPIGPNGAFEVSGMPPGDYYVAAVNHLTPPMAIDADGVQWLAQSARSVHVQAGTSRQLQLAVTPWQR
jgi:hypothetical protein